MIQAGSFTIRRPLHTVCAIILFEEGELQSTVITASERKLIRWENNAMVTFLPGDSVIESEGKGCKVLYSLNYEGTSQEK